MVVFFVGMTAMNYLYSTSDAYSYPLDIKNTIAYSMSIFYVPLLQWILASLWTRMKLLRTSVEKEKLVDKKKMSEILSLTETFFLQTNLINNCFGLTISIMVLELFLYCLVFFYNFH